MHRRALVDLPLVTTTQPPQPRRSMQAIVRRRVNTPPRAHPFWPRTAAVDIRCCGFTQRLFLPTSEDPSELWASSFAGDCRQPIAQPDADSRPARDRAAALWCPPDSGDPHVEAAHGEPADRPSVTDELQGQETKPCRQGSRGPKQVTHRAARLRPEKEQEAAPSTPALKADHIA